MLPPPPPPRTWDLRRLGVIGVRRRRDGTSISGSHCLTLIRRLLMRSSRQARWDSDNTFLFGSSGGAQLGESVESTFSSPTKFPWRAAYASRPSSSSLLLFAAFRQRSKISISPLLPLLTARRPCSQRHSSLSRVLSFSLSLSLSCVIQPEGDFQDVTISCFALSLQPPWTRWGRDMGGFSLPAVVAVLLIGAGRVKGR